MSIRKPPAKLACPKVVTLPAGEQLHRVHRRDYEPTGFNPCKGVPTRFAPIQDATGNCVPSLYAANTLEAAIYETIFHHILAKSRRKTVEKPRIQEHAHGLLVVQRDLRLASLRAPDLHRWRIDRNSLIGSSPVHYRDTSRWAEAVHHQYPVVEGLLWTSNKCDPDTAYLFFGDRVAATDFGIVAVRDGAVDLTFLADVRMAGQRSGITITV